MRKTAGRISGGVVFAVLGAVGAGAAHAQAEDGAWEVDARLTVAGASGGGNEVDAPQADGFAADAGLVVSRLDYLENGLALEWRGELRVRRDAPGRPSFAGGFGTCSGGASCGVVAPATGLFVGGGLVEDGPEAFVEGASLSVSGAWGEGVLGLDAGAAARLDARAPQVMDGVSAFTPMLDPTGLGVVRARNDVTGSSAKITYMSPRWLGVRLGTSYTPEANLAGADFDPEVQNAGLMGAELENIVEGALSFARRFRSSGVRVRAAVTGTSAQSGNAAAGFGDYAAWGAGLELEREGWTGGVRWLTSDNARGGSGDYEALEVGLARDAGPWRFGAEWGSASDDFLGIEGQSWLIGAQRSISEQLKVGVGYQGQTNEYPVLSTPSGRMELERDGLFVEMSVRYR